MTKVVVKGFLLFGLGLLWLAACDKPREQHKPSYEFKSETFPWSRLDACDISMLLCKASGLDSKDFATRKRCEILLETLEQIEGGAYFVRFRGASLRAVVGWVSAAGGASDTANSMCQQLISDIEASVGRSGIETAWSNESRGACVDACWEHELPALSDCVPSRMTATDVWRDRRCSHRLSEDEQRTKLVQNFCSDGCKTAIGPR